MSWVQQCAPNSEEVMPITEMGERERTVLWNYLTKEMIISQAPTRERPTIWEDKPVPE